MIDHVLVTVETPSMRQDMELPLKMPIGELAVKLLEIYREIDFSCFEGKNKVGLVFEDWILPDDKTLEECFVWDGSILIIR